MISAVNDVWSIKLWVVEGKLCNRAVRVNKCIYEGLLLIAWKGFLIWTETSHARSAERVSALLTYVSQFRGTTEQRGFEFLLERDDLAHMRGDHRSELNPEGEILQS